MNTTEQVLLVILSGMLAVFLLLSIIVLVKVIQVLNHIKSITEKAEKIADRAETVGEFFQRTSGPVAIGKLISNIADSFFKNKK